MRKLITIDQKEEWNTYIKESHSYDFYHTWSYHAIDKGGDPILFVYQEKIDFIAFPFIKRSIPNTSFFDLSSVYGYTGPVSNKKFEDLDSCLIDNFKKSFLEFLENEKIVTVFSRLNPFLNQNFLIQKFGSLHRNGRTVAIDLRCTIETQRKKYRETTAKHIKRCIKKGYFIQESKSPEDVEAFYNIYSENMQRVGSTDFYLFNKQHFIELLQSDEIDCRLVLVYAKDKIISGQIIACTNGIVEAYLLGTLQEYLKDSPAKFLFDQVSVIGRTLGMKYYHLGGGLGFKEDSLFYWKTGFSDLFFNYNSWRYIANETVYYHLVEKTGNDINSTVDFFPLYRLLPQQA
ncbi:GNAT family N-acetyltransferase [Pedobacter sp. B4-66]|uniref:GNAT family N-acetyltransferase n=1 Tax=Pedobacter sp. B4-66 TaxID=2817280 RepID=UPI001BD9D9F8|nr:GNAT family N-acetyltransferase [Pedobacter sp. B4-66]